MELINANDKYFFDPTPKLKSSPIPILFVSFNKNDNKCICCGEEYIEAILCNQKYCKKCLSCYINNIDDDSIYLDIYLYTKNLECSEHEISRENEPQNIQECCRHCLEILWFKQMPVSFYKFMHPTDLYYNLRENVNESEKYCKLCGKSLHHLSKYSGCLKLCSDCYLISSGCVKSTLTKKPIPIIYLPWWHNIPYCDACEISLTFTTDHQKYCTNCHIFYIGCRYCLTTNVIFGPTIQSQCRKCKRVSSIIFDITKINIGNSDLDNFLSNLRLDVHNNLKITEFIGKIKDIDKYFRPCDICSSIYQDIEIHMEWIPYSQFKNIMEIAKGGFGIIYQAIWLDGPFYINNKNKNRASTLGSWSFRKKHNEVFNQAELKRKELIRLEKLGPEFSEKLHPEAIFTSRLLSPFISKCTSINSSKDYTSLELDLDIDIERPNVFGTKRNIKKLNTNSYENNGKRIKFK
ncbi:kinase-like domain-containing protein [Rhizophagus irregularis DAOM 181602=DAOM 197198]|nr:kinase-like domain-containing protein [Rhizophagus irregularis DAOM 181602=DAOM 197198]